MFNELYEYVKPAVLAVAGRYAKFGYSKEDCLQEAAMKILSIGVGGPVQVNPAIVKRAVLNHLANIPRESEALLSDDETPDPEAKEDKRVGFTEAEWEDALESAPEPVAWYLQKRVVDGESWNVMVSIRSITSYALASIRSQAADWLLAQLEGRKG